MWTGTAAQGLPSTHFKAVKRMYYIGVIWPYNIGIIFPHSISFPTSQQKVEFSQAPVFLSEGPAQVPATLFTSAYPATLLQERHMNTTEPVAPRIVLT